MAPVAQRFDFVRTLGRMAEGGHARESTLWKEDVFTAGHRSVWGSLYDLEAKRWGYACCKSFERGSSCSVAAAEKQAKVDPGADSGLEKTSPNSEDMAEENPWDFRDPPRKLLPPAEVKRGSPAAYLEHFVTFMIGEWHRLKEAGFPGFNDIERAAFQPKGALEEVQKGIAPLLWRLKKGESLDRGEKKDTNRSRETRTSMEGKFVKEKSVLQQLFLMASMSWEMEYVKVHEAYMHMTFGNKMWNLTYVTHVAACTMKGAREYRRNRDSLNTYDMDPLSQKYMHAFKKLAHLCQCLRPNPDVSKNFVM